MGNAKLLIEDDSYLHKFVAEALLIGISKENLANINPWAFDTQQDLLNFILDSCEELDPWLPIEDAPKDRYIRVFAPAYDDLPAMQQVCKWHESAGFCIDELRTPTHYKELDDEPKNS